MQPNTLIFVDFPSDDVEACARFYHDVFGWEVEGRPTGVFHRGVPGGHFPLEDGSPSPIGNLHVQMLRLVGVAPIIVLEPTSRRAELAGWAGADVV